MPFYLLIYHEISFLVYRNIFGVTKSGDIYISSQGKSGDWASPKPIAYKDKKISNKINSTYFESSASITSDGKYIYFVSERPGGQGQADIYFVKKQGKTYGICLLHHHSCSALPDFGLDTEQN